MTRPTRQTASGRAYLDLQNQARRQRRPTQELLILYALERWLARLETSSYSADFVLKGGMLMAALDARRATVDADLLARGISNDEESIAHVVGEIASIAVAPDDGVSFDADTIEAQVIRESDQYSGVRVSIMSLLGSARLSVRLDISVGEPVVPEPRTIVLPSLRPVLPAVSILGYSVETVLAEKLCTAVALGEANTRVRDYADVYTLVTRHSIRFEALQRAFNATAEYRGVVPRSFQDAVGGLAELRGATYQIYRANLADQGEHLPLRFDAAIALIAEFVAPLLGNDISKPVAWDPAMKEWRPHEI